MYIFSVLQPNRNPFNLPGENLCLSLDSLNRNTDALGLHGVLLSNLLAELLTAAAEYLVEVVLVEADVRVQSRELPYAVDLAVPVNVSRVGVSLDGNVLAARVCVSLVRHAQLVGTDDFRVRDLLPLSSADEVLRREERVS